MPETTYLRAQIAREYGLRTGLGIPLISSDQVLAVLIFYMFESHEQDERLVELISALTQLGAVIQRKQAEAALQKAYDELEIRVRERTAELKNANEELRTEITSRQQAESELRASAVQLWQQAFQLEQALHKLQKTQAQLIQTEKMSSLGQMVAGIAHEINNPVNLIYGNIQYTNEYIQDLLNLVQLYQQQYPHPTAAIQAQTQDIDLEFIAEDLPKMLDSLKMGAERIRQLVVSLRNFSRLDEAQVKHVDLHQGIDNTLLILNYQLKLGITVSKQYGDLPLVECYPAQLNQVFMNLLSNAIDALNESASLPDKQIVIQTQAIAPNQIRVRIGDNGPGIPSEIKDHIFDPFFTTKPVGKGTGLGLSICYQVIEKHRGQISVSSHLGQGTEFVITLPVNTAVKGD